MFRHQIVLLAPDKPRCLAFSIKTYDMFFFTSEVIHTYMNQIKDIEFAKTMLQYKNEILRKLNCAI